MRRIGIILSAIALWVVTPRVTQAATVTNNVVDATGNPAVTYLLFTPPKKYQAYGTNFIVCYPVRANVDSNQNFSITIQPGGFYDVTFGNDTTLPPLRVLLPVNDTNTYSLNQVAQLAVNASMFGLANVTVTNFQIGGGASATNLNTVTSSNATIAIALSPNPNGSSNLDLSVPAVNGLGNASQGNTNTMTVAKATLVTGSQSNIITLAVTNTQTAVTLAGNFSGGLDARGNITDLAGQNGNFISVDDGSGNMVFSPEGNIIADAIIESSIGINSTSLDGPLSLTPSVEGATGMPIYLAHGVVGSGAGLTNLNASQISSGTLPLPQLTPGVITNATFVTPIQFNAIGNGAANDTSALSNAVAAVNAGTSQVLDLMGRTYFVTSGFAFTVPQTEMKNGSIVVPSNFLGAVITCSTATSSFGSKGNHQFYNLTIGRQGTNAPDPSTVGIQTGVYNTSYRNDVTIHDCEISNFWRGIVVVDTPQFQIWHNRTGFNWSNQVYVASPSSTPGSSGEGGDESTIAFNDLNYLDMAAGIATIDQSIYHNQICIQLDATCIDLAIDFNNVAGMKQFVKTSPLCGSGLEFRGNEVEELFSTSSNICAVEIWNSIVHWDNCKIAGINGSFGSSNYLAAIGLYATNGSHLNFSRCSFKGDFGEGSGNLFDIWSADGFLTPIDGYPLPLVLTGNPGSIRWHNTFGDVGTVIMANQPFNTYPWGMSGTNCFIASPFGGVVTIGAANALQIFNINGVGQYAQFANSPVFNTGATFGTGPALYDIYDRGGGQGFLGEYAQWSQDLRLFSGIGVSSGGIPTIPDMDFKQGTNTAACVNLMTNIANVFAGSHSGNAAGLTNLTPMASLGPNSCPGSNAVAAMIVALAPSGGGGGGTLNTNYAAWTLDGTGTQTNGYTDSGSVVLAFTNFTTLFLNGFTGWAVDGCLTNTFAGKFKVEYALNFVDYMSYNPVYNVGIYTNGVKCSLGVQTPGNNANSMSVSMRYNPLAQCGQVISLPAGTKIQLEVNNSQAGPFNILTGTFSINQLQ